MSLHAALSERRSKLPTRHQAGGWCFQNHHRAKDHSFVLHDWSSPAQVRPSPDNEPHLQGAMEMKITISMQNKINTCSGMKAEKALGAAGMNATTNSWKIKFPLLPHLRLCQRDTVEGGSRGLAMPESCHAATPAP